MGSFLIPALIAVTTMSLLVAALYLHLFFNNKDKLLLLWSASWGVYSLRFVIQTLLVLHILPPWMVVVQEAATLTGALLCMAGANALANKSAASSSWWWYGAGISLGWLVLVQIVHLPFFWADLPISFFTGLLFFWSGVIILRQTQISGPGRRVSGYALILWGIHRADYTFLRPVAWFAPWGFLLAAALFLTAAIGILLLYFEKIRAELEQEIHNRNLAEASLAESEKNLKESQQIAHVGSWQLDLITNQVIWSDQLYKMYGFDPALPPPPYTEHKKLFTPESWERLSAALKNSADTGIPYELELEMVRKDGSHGWMWVHGKTVLDAMGVMVGLRGTVQDITERKKAEEERKNLQAQLNQAQKMESVGRLAGGVAHDYNNMLGIIIGYTELAIEKTTPTDPLYADLAEILSAAKRSADITQQLLAFARKQTISPKVLDLNDTIESMLKMLRRLIGEDVDLAWLPGAELWPVKIDPGQVDQILVNLCVNARDAIMDIGKITIETGKAIFDEVYCADHVEFVPGEYVLLAVSDNGGGMAPETLDMLFEPFFTTKDVNKGTGLGLATVYGIVKQNNGFINAYSEPEKGTTFRIYFPRHESDAKQVHKEAPVASDARGRETILLVEDEPAILRMTTMMLELLSYTVLGASMPGEAIHLAHEHSGEIHLLMTDVVMPEMNGRDLARKLLTLYPNLKLLFMSGYTANVIAHHGVLDEGVNFFIQKPFSMKDLASKVREALDK